MAAPMKWTSEMESSLIEEIKQQRHLWDHTDKYFKLRKLKQATYEEIVEKMKENFPDHQKLFTLGTVTSKFANMKTVFQRNIRKVKNLSSGSRSEGFIMPWTHFEQLQFLASVEPVEPSISNLNESCESSQFSLLDASTYCEMAMDDQQAVEEPLIKFPPSPAVPIISNKRRKRSIQDNDFLIKACETLNSVVTAQISAEDALGQYIAQKLKTITDPAKQNAAEADLIQTLMKYV